MKTYGVVLIGCGAMGAAHLASIATHPQVRLVGVADLIQEKAEAFASRYQAESWSTNYKEYLLREDVEIVIIATYPSTHLDISRNCLGAGKHVLCEKPMAGTLKEAAEMVRIGSTSKAKLLIGHILRHNSTYQRVGDLIKGGEIGKPIVMRMTQLKNTSHNWDSHLALLEQVSPIVDCGGHYVDILRWITGAEVMNISGIGQRLEQDVPYHTYNYGMISMRFTDGSIGTYEAGWGHAMPQDNLKEFIGPKGRIRIIYRNQRPPVEQHLGNLIEIEYTDGRTCKTNVPFASKPTDVQMEYLFRMIEQNLDAGPLLRDFYKALEITLRGDQAIHENLTLSCLDLPVAEAANY